MISSMIVRLRIKGKSKHFALVTEPQGASSTGNAGRRPIIQNLNICCT